MKKRRASHHQVSFTVSGVTYHRLEDVPAEYRKMFVDTDGDGQPDGIGGLTRMLGVSGVGDASRDESAEKSSSPPSASKTTDGDAATGAEAFSADRAEAEADSGERVKSDWLDTTDSSPADAPKPATSRQRPLRRPTSISIVSTSMEVEGREADRLRSDVPPEVQAMIAAELARHLGVEHAPMKNRAPATIVCSACGYDLSGASIGGKCSECGHLVADSIRALAGPGVRSHRGVLGYQPWWNRLATRVGMLVIKVIFVIVAIVLVAILRRHL